MLIVSYLVLYYKEREFIHGIIAVVVLMVIGCKRSNKPISFPSVSRSLRPQDKQRGFQLDLLLIVSLLIQ